MLLYHLHDLHHAAVAPFRVMANAMHVALHPHVKKEDNNHLLKAVSAGAELFERTTRRFHKQSFGLEKTNWRDQTVPVVETTRLSKPFCNLIEFKRGEDENDPKLLIVAPISGHHSTLLRGTVEALLPHYRVFITDWIDAKMVPLSQGKFDLEDNVSYIMEFIRLLGPDLHIMAVCQPAVPVLCAVSLLAQAQDPAQPSSMILMGGPVDVARTKSSVSEMAQQHSIEWFRAATIHSLPFYYPGAHRMVYPGFLQLQGFVSMNVERHVGEHYKLFQNLIKGDDESAAMHRRFYDEYLSVMDVPAEFYLQTIERVFHRRDLATGNFEWRDQKVDPSAITRTALLTVEGELDDISPPGQTLAAHDLCSSLSADKKKAYLQIGVGHYGIFNGRKWREHILPVVRAFTRAHS